MVCICMNACRLVKLPSVIYSLRSEDAAVVTVAGISEVVIGLVISVKNVVWISEVVVGLIVLKEDADTIGTEIGDDGNYNSSLKGNIM